MNKLEQAAQNLLKYWDSDEDGLIQNYITALREALAEQAEQEPVAEIIGFERTNDIRGVKRIPRIKWNVPLWEDESPLQLGNLYTHHVRTKDLTDDEIEWLVVDTLETWNSKDTMKDFARAVIAKYKEKNK